MEQSKPGVIIGCLLIFCVLVYFKINPIHFGKNNQTNTEEASSSTTTTLVTTKIIDENGDEWTVATLDEHQWLHISVPKGTQPWFSRTQGTNATWVLHVNGETLEWKKGTAPLSRMSYNDLYIKLPVGNSYTEQERVIYYRVEKHLKSEKK